MESLLELSSELKRAALLGDQAAIEAEVQQGTARCREQSEDGERRLARMRVEMQLALQELEASYGASSSSTL